MTTFYLNREIVQHFKAMFHVAYILLTAVLVLMCDSGAELSCCLLMCVSVTLSTHLDSM